MNQLVLFKKKKIKNKIKTSNEDFKIRFDFLV